MSIDYYLIGNRIKNARKQCQVTQESLSEMINVSVGYISQIERAIAKVNLDTLSKISIALNYDLSYFISGVAVAQTAYLESDIASTWNKLTERQRKMIIEFAETVNKYENE